MTMECTTVAGWTKKTAAVGLAALLSAGVAVAQQKPVAPAAAKAAVVAKPVVEEEEAATTPKKPGTEGIKVHGHWVIDLKDKDGKLIEHRDFQNAIDIAGGSSSLAGLLLGSIVPSTLEIDAAQTTSAYGGLGYTYISYRMYQANRGVTGNCHEATGGVYNLSGNTIYCLPQMTQTYVAPAPVAGGGGFGLTYSSAAVVLSGQFIATAPITINKVSSFLATCSGTGLSTQSPSDCAAAPAYGYQNQEARLTGTSIAPLDVATGQQLTITVTLTFS